MEGNKRLIDLDVAKKLFDDIPPFIGMTGKCVQEMLDKAPAVDAVEVVHGRWEWLGPNRLVRGCMCGTCSVCKVRSKYIVNTLLCPNCGAKMDGDGND